MSENAVEPPRVPSPEDIAQAEKHKEKANEFFKSTYKRHFFLI